MLDITAIVVARSGSKRLPGKALLPFRDSNLVGYKVRMLKQCPLVSRVVIGSDCPRILEAGAIEGAIDVLRDAYHCDESRCSANEMLADMAGKVDGDHVLWAHPTNPLIKPETFTAAIQAYKAGLESGCDSLVSVNRVQRHAWQHGAPLNFNPWQARHPSASELSPILFQDGAIFIQSRQQMIDGAYFYGRKPVLFEVDAVEGWDVDTREDYAAAMALGQLVR